MGLCFVTHSTCLVFETDCKNLVAVMEYTQEWPNFSKEPKEITVLERRFQYFITSKLSTFVDLIM